MSTDACAVFTAASILNGCVKSTAMASWCFQTKSVIFTKQDTTLKATSKTTRQAPLLQTSSFTKWEFWLEKISVVNHPMSCLCFFRFSCRKHQSQVNGHHGPPHHKLISNNSNMIMAECYNDTLKTNDNDNTTGTCQFLSMTAGCG